jgi:hypothetical protein
MTKGPRLSAPSSPGTSSRPIAEEIPASTCVGEIVILK